MDDEYEYVSPPHPFLLPGGEKESRAESVVFPRPNGERGRVRGEAGRDHEESGVPLEPGAGDDARGGVTTALEQDDAHTLFLYLTRAESLGVPCRLDAAGAGILARCLYLTARDGRRVLAVQGPGGALDLKALACALGMPRLSLSGESTALIELGVSRRALTPLMMFNPDMADARVVFAPALRGAEWLGFACGGRIVWLEQAGLRRALGASLSCATLRGSQNPAANPRSAPGSPPAP